MRLSLTTDEVHTLQHALGLLDKHFKAQDIDYESVWPFKSHMQGSGNTSSKQFLADQALKI